ncbi:hypothetical protein M9458_053174 [Cirrhinus mrigala]|uniref:Uncharacterized protein n=1 Tax=Cirrhinus mrigala TaxID=683832 RepID=A0ABD0MQW8_CIRMR
MSEIVGADGGSVPCSSVGPAPHAAVSMVGQKSEHFTSFSSTPQNYGDAQRLLRFRSMEEPPFPSGGSPARSVLSSQNYHDGCILYGLGGGPSRTPSLWSLDRGASWLAHKSFGDDGSLPGPQIVLTSFEGLSRLAQDGQHNGFVPESSGRSTLSPPSQAGEAGSSLGSDQVPVAASTSVQSTVRQGGAFAVGGPTVAHSAVILGPGQSASRPSLGGSSQTRSADSSPWHDLASLTGIMEVVDVTPERSALMCSGLSVEITDTIINSQQSIE